MRGSDTTEMKYGNTTRACVVENQNEYPAWKSDINVWWGIRISFNDYAAMRKEAWLNHKCALQTSKWNNGLRGILLHIPPTTTSFENVAQSVNSIML